MLLILDRTGTNGNIGENVGQIPPVFRIKELIGCGKTGYFDCFGMKTTCCDDSLEKIRFFFRIRLMQNAFIAVTGRTGLAGLDSWYEN